MREIIERFRMCLAYVHMNLALNRDLDPYATHLHCSHAHSHTYSFVHKYACAPCIRLVRSLYHCMHETVFICRFRKDIIPYHSHTVVTGNRYIFFFSQNLNTFKPLLVEKVIENPATNWHWKNERETHRGSTDRAYRYFYVCMRVPLMNVHWIVWLYWLETKTNFSLVWKRER